MRRRIRWLGTCTVLSCRTGLHSKLSSALCMSLYKISIDEIRKGILESVLLNFKRGLRLKLSGPRYTRNRSKSRRFSRPPGGVDFKIIDFPPIDQICLEVYLSEMTGFTLLWHGRRTRFTKLLSSLWPPRKQSSHANMEAKYPYSPVSEENHQTSRVATLWLPTLET